MREESLQSNAQELELNRTLFEDCPSSASAVLETRAWLEGSCYDNIRCARDKGLSSSIQS